MKRAAARAALAALAAALASLCWPAWAGAPFLTDDPDPIPYGHWEVFAATQWAVARHTSLCACPLLDVNYGALPGLQLHAIVPALLGRRSGESLEFGLGDLELGAKLRLVDESEQRPMVGIYPLLTVPTGSEARGLGVGAVTGFVPVWIQKSSGPWLTYGGGGVRFAPGGDAVLLGWVLQRKLSAWLELGAEGFATVPLNGAMARVQLNLGAIVNLSELHHVVLSAGPAFGAQDGMQAYLAYQLTF